MMRPTWILCLVAAVLLKSEVRAFSKGAPDSACISMIPGHNVDPQDSPSPYTVELAPIKNDNGRRLVNVTIVSQGNADFAGFIIQARPDGGNNALGSFEVRPELGKTHTCGSGLKNSVTHVDAKRKRTVELVWEAPSNFDGHVTFNATVVHNFATFWTGIKSIPLIVRSTPTGVEYDTSSNKPTTRVPYKSTVSTTTTARPLSGSQVANPIYEGCNSIKGCFGWPSNCVNSKSCRALVTYKFKSLNYEFELYADDRIWAAAAFSHDKIMAEDAVMECVYEEDKNEVNAYVSWNEAANPRKGNHRVESDLNLLESSYKDKQLYCRFTKPRISTIEGVEFDLDKPYHLFVAAGTDLKGNRLGYHQSERDLTAEKISLTDIQEAKGASKILVHLHGAFMIAAWIGAASIGILLARYFKKTWVGSQLCAKDQWFAWHRVFMLFAWCLTLAGFVIIFIEIGGWSSADNPHAILGCITTGLAFIQPFMAALRPAPNAPRRPLFNWCHWLVGNLAHIFGIVTIFFAVLLPRAELPDWTNWILVGYVGVHVVMHLIFSIAGCASDRKKRVNSFPMRDLSHSRNSAHSHHEKSQDAPYSCIRKFLFAIYFIGVVSVTVALIVIVVLAPIEDTFKDVKSKLNI
ncbi:putative ferric-chelate reductase 1 homolog [Neocloeon triangulifer]|uniref:putative ferric-chelate reductase 1 homolog n=1 Tax=Neocloeon triangulifer TaxID=2078957 RepID=UPI00286F51F4|nr:putative ferric-chelate reductase 1 homolog [Neocloeon triangulifer]XP_059484958.1 putative ferric-chelate reductase 1 homolog [Neocloeon triangulifer]